MACAWLAEALGDDPPRPPAIAAAGVGDLAWGAVARMARTGLSAPVTTSAGRLFDAVAALCGLRARVTFEGQAAMELEAACDPHERGEYPMPGLDPHEAVLAVARDAAAGVPAGVIAARFHSGLAAATAAACAEAAGAAGTAAGVLSGGVFENRRLADEVAARLGRAGLRVLLPERLPPNDGGVSYGQAAIAAVASAG